MITAGCNFFFFLQTTNEISVQVIHELCLFFGVFWGSCINYSNKGVGRWRKRDVWRDDLLYSWWLDHQQYWKGAWGWRVYCVSNGLAITILRGRGGERERESAREREAFNRDICQVTKAERKKLGIGFSHLWLRTVTVSVWVSIHSLLNVAGNTETAISELTQLIPQTCLQCFFCCASCVPLFDVIWCVISAL